MNASTPTTTIAEMVASALRQTAAVLVALAWHDALNAGDLFPTNGPDLLMMAGAGAVFTMGVLMDRVVEKARLRSRN